MQFIKMFASFETIVKQESIQNEKKKVLEKKKSNAGPFPIFFKSRLALKQRLSLKHLWN